MTSHYTKNRDRGGRHFSPGARHARHRSRAGKFSRGIDVSRFVRTDAIAEPSAAYEPVHAFADFAIDERIKSNIVRKGYETPTHIQDQSIPHILDGRDIVGIANTGTGKTGAFLIPLLDKVVKDRDKRVLIIVPTRELALQIEEEFKGFARGSGFFSVCAVGGVNINPQVRILQQDPLFVIGT